MNVARSAVMAVCFLSSVPNLVHVISHIAKIEPYLFPTFDCMMTSWKLTSSTIFGHVGIFAWSCRFFVTNFVQISSSSAGAEILACYEIQDSHHLPCLICSAESWDHPRRPMVAITCKKFRHDRLSSLKVGI